MEYVLLGLLKWERRDGLVVIGVGMVQGVVYQLLLEFGMGKFKLKRGGREDKEEEVRD